MHPADPDEYLTALSGLPLLDGLVVDCSIVWDPAETATAIGERLECDPATIAGAVTHGDRLVPGPDERLWSRRAAGRALVTNERAR
jgi:hypothetical protein